MMMLALDNGAEDFETTVMTSKIKVSDILSDNVDTATTYNVVITETIKLFLIEPNIPLSTTVE
mgnify:CR=1 FL=1